MGILAAFESLFAGNGAKMGPSGPVLATRLNADFMGFGYLLNPPISDKTTKSHYFDQFCQYFIITLGLGRHLVAILSAKRPSA